MDDRHKSTLCKLAIGDDAFVEALLPDAANLAASGLDRRSHALVRLGALIALDVAPPSYMGAIQSACRSGVSEEEIVGCLVAVMPAVGPARVVSAAPRLALGLGYDVAGALEDPGDPRS